MSRIGLSPIKIPNNLGIDIDGCVIKFSFCGVRKVYEFPNLDIVAERRGDCLYLVSNVNIDQVKSDLGLHRSLIKNIVLGLSDGFKKELSVVGVGYKVMLTKKYLVVSIGYSHDIYYLIPAGISIEVVKDLIILKSDDKILIGSVAVDICNFRKFDPYKGKGIYAKGDFLLRKQAKKK